MRISVQVKTNSKIEGVDLQPDGIFIVRVHTPPIEGKANKRICELLSVYLNKPKSRIQLVSGHKSKIKIFEVEES